MNRVSRVAAAIMACGMVMAAGAAQADNVIARWIQIGPGSTSATPTIANFGDNPFSTTNTVLARAIVTDGVCPAATLDHSSVLTMNARFAGSQLTGTASLATTIPSGGTAPTAVPGVNPLPGSPGKTTAAAGYPQYFINGNNTAGTVLPGINGGPAATSAWTECEAIVPAGHTTATIGGVDLKLPVAHPQRVLVIADTGCRINGNKSASGGNQQNCQDARAFPLNYLSNYEATFKPDLIVLVGDVFYRDTNCKTSGADTFAGCSNSTSSAFETWGDTFDSWNGDFFFPAKTLLASAPWAIARGNHESCGRGARGWFALLDPHPYDFSKVGCNGVYTNAQKNAAGTAPNLTANYHNDFTPTFPVPVGTGVNLLIHDSSFATDGSVDAPTATNYDAELTAVLTSLGASSTNVFVSHKPVFGLAGNYVPSNNGTGGFGTAGAGGKDNAGDFTEQATFTGTYANSAFSSTLTSGLTSQIGLFLHGHIHQLQYIKGMPHFPPSLIVGTGGDLLDADLGLVVSGATVTTPDGWTANPAFTQTAGNFVINKLSGTTTEAFSKTYSLDQFGFAVLDAINTAGTTTGFTANAYKVTSSRAGRCTITLGNGAGQSRDMACNF